jgi:hypothetical protein
VPAYFFSKFASLWEYYQVTTVNSERLKRIKVVCIVILAQTFNPAKFSSLLDYLTKAYLDGGSVLPVMQSYLSSFTDGKVERESPEGPSSFDSKAFDDKRALISEVNPIMNMFASEAVLIWVAILLKKRIFVYGNDIQHLLSFVRSFPLIGGWHRQNWGILRPFVSASDATLELKDLEAAGVYVAGFTDAKCVSLETYYDLFCDLTTATITVPEHAQGSFQLGRFHQQTINGFLKIAAAGQDQATIKFIASKTKEMLDTLRTLVVEDEDGSPVITLEHLSSQGLPVGMDKFLFHVAKAEGLAQR